MRKICFLVLGLICVQLNYAQTLTPLTVEKIMKDPKWIGTSPSNPQWEENGKRLFFQWNPEGNYSDSLYYITLTDRTPKKLPAKERNDILFAGSVKYNEARTHFVYAKQGDIFLREVKTGKTIQITATASSESNPEFAFGDKKIVFTTDQDVYAWDIQTGTFSQLSRFVRNQPGRPGPGGERQAPLSEQQAWLKNDQLAIFEVLAEKKKKREAAEAYRNSVKEEESIPSIPIGDHQVRGVQLSNDGRYLAFMLFRPGTDRSGTIVPDYVTESGFTTDIPARAKVGTPPVITSLHVFDLKERKKVELRTDSLPGLAQEPDYKREYFPGRNVPSIRQVSVSRLLWSPKGTHLVAEIRSTDNKDRWIVKVDPATGMPTTIDHQRDEAWIAGPGISGFNIGWVSENELYFQSERTGYSHLYVANVNSLEQKAITSGKYEVQSCVLSKDKKSFYITTNEVHPGEKHLYKVSTDGSKKEKLTHMTGANQAVVSPDEKYIAFLYSYTNKPWELYIQENKPNAKPVQITDKGASELFRSYPWRDPEIVEIKARDGQTIYGRLYKPANPHPAKPAVIFVHGAGYLQNAHKWWSQYFREYMFHNLLADAGYTVLDLDYRASAGYGRDWRTGIYRHMGGKDLDDNIDGAKYLVEQHGVDPERIGIYGGSYGGFITLMALFTSPGTFAAGAALRPVTDWAHYNHGYTSNILNTPVEDSIAYKRSSPIYFADGLQDHLLICHGLVDVNVHIQDVFRLSQKLIELGKENWELAVYPVEDHGFTEPSSWTDEYKRILNLFERVLKKN